MDEIIDYECGCCPNCGAVLSPGNYEYPPTIEHDDLYYDFTCPECHLSGMECYVVGYNCSIIKFFTDEDYGKKVHDKKQTMDDHEAEGINDLF
ncbi:MAG: hypothetical protein EPN82_09790 [Bacteroidetes bacterium]|nr:MAG: hypothetical protein EPN82_09790 [Bacteroidota bacterium]